MPGSTWALLALVCLGTCRAHSLFTCEPIKVHRCLGVPYNTTFFPNMMEHYDQDVAASSMEVSLPVTAHVSGVLFTVWKQAREAVKCVVIVWTEFAS